jgi:hypothetical protein
VSSNTEELGFDSVFLAKAMEKGELFRQRKCHVQERL